MRVILGFILVLLTVLVPVGEKVFAFPKVGVVFSEQTEISGDQPYHPGSNLGRVAVREREELVFNMLKERGYTPSKLSDADLKNLTILRRYDTIVFPYTFLLDESQSAVVREYVRAGGGIILLFAVPRAKPPFVPWIKFFQHNAWEWGPLSEVYQFRFVNDPFNAGFSATSRNSNHPIIKAVKNILGISLVTLTDPEPVGVELMQALKNNYNTTPIMWYTSGYPAIWAGGYGRGKYVYFAFKPMDFWWHTRLASQALVAKELVIQSIKWAARPEEKTYLINRSVRTAAKVTLSYKSGFFVKHLHTGTGNIQAIGDVITTIYNPSGKKIYEVRRNRVGAVPGVTLNWSFSWKPKSIKGRYRVTVTYLERYRRFKRIETVYISPGQYGVLTTTTKVEVDEPALASFYRDVSKNYWAKGYIEYLFRRGIISGYPGGTFVPDKAITRAEFVKLIVTAMGWDLVEPDQPSFKDVNKSHWAYRYIETARAEGAIIGFPDGTFRPENKTTRAEIAVMALRAKGYQLITTAVGFKDLPTNHWARTYILTAKERGIVSGYKDGTFKPENPAARAEATKVIFGILE